jgi:hypothetical protein
MTVKVESTMPVKKTAQFRTGRPFQFYAADEFFAAIDKWRAQQPGLPGRSEAIRHLVGRGLAVEASSFLSAVEPEKPKKLRPPGKPHRKRRPK